MNIEFKPTRRGGGVTIKGDDETIYLIERLLTKHAMQSQCCYEDGACMALSHYFNPDKNESVDWITLVVGITVLRTSLGYNCSKQDHALITAIEYQLQRALCSVLKVDTETIDDVLGVFKGYSDHTFNDDWYGIMVYLYLLKTAKNRKRKLLSLLKFLDPIYRALNKEEATKFDNLSLTSLYYPAGTKFEYEL
ncbi:hypothetical protein VA249_45990 (plasmid) [Vibrio alfacsensis]|uniref:hypothetical protein n=1 Tax=Vibrio alfacsensis TaxID=1074311 RepID=UPI001BEDC678|nr:hypothetical protein [Vibrio alfacsensis]BBM67953.1 hypothetical protein VA249_45990 [Vibrio alfacsensis]